MSGSGGGVAARMWAGRELRRRWVSLVVLGLLAGITTGLAAAAVAGARQTNTAWERLRDETHASDAIVFTSQAGIFFDDELDYDSFTDLPYVQSIGAFGVWYGASELGEASGFMSTYGDWLDGVDTPRIVEGRAPDPDHPGEVVVTEPQRGNPLYGFGVGDTIDVGFFTQEQQFAERYDEPEGPQVALEIVGITDSPFNRAAIPSDGDMYVGPAFRERYGPGLAAFSNLMVRLKDPERDLPRLEAEVARKYPGRGVPVYDLGAAGKRVTNGTDLERSGLLLFAAAVVIAGVVIIGQALTRSVRASGADVPVLASLGFSHRDSALALSLPHVLSVVVAGVVAITVAIALSPRFPIGLGRRIDPNVGLHVDVVVVLVGAALVAAVLAGAIAWTAWRAASMAGDTQWSRRSTIASALLRAGAPVTATTGASLALEPGRGQRALPTRPAILGAISGALGVIGALTLAAGISDATSHPERFGSVWDFEVEFGEDPGAFQAVPGALADNSDVADVARVARLALPVDELVLPFYALDEVNGSTDFVALEGRGPERSGEVLIGPDSADTLGVAVGDQIDIGSGGRFRVVGLGLLPTTAHSSFDQGGWMVQDDLAESVPASQRPSLAQQAGLDQPTLSDAEIGDLMFDFGYVVGSYRGGVDADVATTRLVAEFGDAVTVFPASGPADQENLRNVRPLPILFAVFALALAVGALAHVSASVLRRRRGELAVLRSLGFTPRQARACLGWQATFLALIGLVIGVPLGVALGRVIWRVVADTTPMVYVAPLAVLALVLAVPVALLLANLLAAVPGHRAARLRPAEVLRTE